MRSYDAAGNYVERLRQPLYDSISITTTATEFKFFSTPRGQSSKTTWHTNLDTAGSLPNPKTHVVDGIRVVPTQLITSSMLADYRQLLWNQTWFELTIGGLKPYLQVPLWYLPAGFGLPGFSDSGGLTSVTAYAQVSNGAPIMGNFFGIRSHPILLPSQQTFSATIHADSALSSMSQAIRTWVVFEGLSGRETL